MAEVIRKYSVEECEAYREKMMSENILPTVERKFEKFPALRSAVMFVAQYWCDEAYDAVHAGLVYSVKDNPDIEQYYKYKRDECESEGREDFDYNRDCDEHLEWLMEGSKSLSQLGLPEDHKFTWDMDDFIKEWDDNYETIPFFAAFTKEGGDQEEPFKNNYTPYAVFFRREDGVSVDVVGKMIRPELDGVACEWEQEEEKYASQQTKAPGKPGFWARLFGRK